MLGTGRGILKPSLRKILPDPAAFQGCLGCRGLVNEQTRASASTKSSTLLDVSEGVRPDHVRAPIAADFASWAVRWLQ